MESIIIIFMFVCGQADTVIVKFPNNPEATVTHSVKHPDVQDAIIDILKKDPVIITYEDERSICA